MYQYKKGRWGFDYKLFQRIRTKNDSYINSEIQGLRGYREISVRYHSQYHLSESINDNNIRKAY